MATSKELMERRANIHYQMKDVLNKAKTEGREPNEEESRQFDAWDSEFESLSKQIERLEKLEQREAELTAEKGHNLTREEKKVLSADPKENEERRGEAFKKYASRIY